VKSFVSEREAVYAVAVSIRQMVLGIRLNERNRLHATRHAEMPVVNRWSQAPPSAAF
jgi:hypothetical protein